MKEFTKYIEQNRKDMGWKREKWVWNTIGNEHGGRCIWKWVSCGVKGIRNDIKQMSKVKLHEGKIEND